MSRRNTELLLLCLAAPFVVLLFAMVLVQQGTSLSLESLTAPLGLFAAFVVAHIATRFLAKNADPAILPITFGLSGIGIAFVTRLAPDLAVSQIIWLFVGIACMVITLAVVRNIDRLSQYKYTFMVLGIILLVLGIKNQKMAKNIFGIVFSVTGLLGILSLTGVPYLEVGIPGILSLYFDVFSGGVQALVFSLLTMVYIGNACPPPEEV